MKLRKIEVILLIILVLFAFGVRLVTLPKGDFLGADNFYHYSILKQSYENKELSTDNNLDVCYEGVKGGHPVGFYLIPYWLSYIMGPFNALAISSALYAAISILLCFLLFKLLFNSQIAFIASFLIAGTNAHLARSVALIYKGDNLISIFLFLGLIFAVKMLEEDRLRLKLYYALGVGFATGLATMFWNGYLLVLAIVNTSIILYILYEYIKQKEVRLNLIAASVALAVQFVLVEALGHMFVTIFADFYKVTYILYFILPAFILFGVLEIFGRLGQKDVRLRYLPFVLFALFGLIIFVWKFAMILEILTGFGYIKADDPFSQNIQELTPLTWSYLWFHVWFFILTAIGGLYFLFKNMTAKRVFAILLVVVFGYMMIVSKRYVFLASIPIQLCSALFIYALINSFKKYKKWLYVVPILLILVNAAYSVNAVTTHLNPRVDDDFKNSLYYLQDNSEDKSCVISTWEKGGMVQAYSGRHSYTSSVGGQHIERIKTVNDFFLNNINQFTQENLYVLVQESDLLQIKSMTPLIETENIGGSIIAVTSLQDKGEYEEMILQSNVDGKRYMINRYKDGSNVEFYILNGAERTSIKTLIVKQTDKPTAVVEKSEYNDDGCLFIGNKISAYFSRALCDSNLVRLIADLDVEDLTKTYSGRGISIYKFN
ncbi:hypothetical protein HN419_06040 [Candidatus Woesearchaeota archaeon]|jgi:asparagine N-glycosylation enzyme membrane subunit Stt3|nr:hypothetical protein [Candidatus Woesearchaeota archaeon]MBT3537569.1 hypothetical protein [Candidatus Woesearchaeota archaeon]MBT7105238.1 hypothetical protein [Candidatus Woesearchaeota archaeon]MBT7930501.1 hypothetical protein [Candidatus Woesearchaeota archaeon]